MKTLLTFLAVLLCFTASGQQTNRTPLNRAFLQSDFDGNGKRGTNFGTLRATNFIDAATGLSIAGNTQTNDLTKATITQLNSASNVLALVDAGKAGTNDTRALRLTNNSNTLGGDGSLVLNPGFGWFDDPNGPDTPFYNLVMTNGLRWFSPSETYSATNFNGFLILSPEYRLGQNILYIGDGANSQGQLFDAVAWLASTTNSSGQTHGQFAPRVTMGFKVPPVGLNYGSYTTLYRFELFGLTLNTPFNVNASEPYQQIFQHNNTNLIIWGADWWTNRYTGTNIAIGNLAKASGRNGIAIGNVTNVNDNTVNIGSGSSSSSFYAGGAALVGNSAIITSAGANFFTGGFTIDSDGDVEATSFSGDIDPVNLTAGTAGISISGNAATATTSVNASGTGSAAKTNDSRILELATIHLSGDLSAIFGTVEALNVNGGTFTGNGRLLTSLSASNLTGTVPAAQMPALTGAITSSAGSVATSLGSFTSANLATALTDETGTGAAVFANSATVSNLMVSPSGAVGNGSSNVFQVNGTNNAMILGVNATNNQLNIRQRIIVTGDTAAFATDPSISFMDVNANSASRNWGLFDAVQNFGDFGIVQSNSKGSDPASGTPRMIFDASGNVIVGLKSGAALATLDVLGSGRFTTTLAVGTVLTVTNSANIRTNTGAMDVTTSDLVLATRYTNTARRAFVSATVQSTAAVAGTAKGTLYVEHASITNKVSIGGGPLAGMTSIGQVSLPVSPSAVYYIVDESSGSGASVAIVSGTCSLTAW